MPPRTEAIRRCSFKLPKNDKYQCQKAGDKFQPIVKRWYCTSHDSHAQDRCQVLVVWAGIGAQCERLGVFDKKIGKKLCELHLPQSIGVDKCPKIETEQCDDFRQRNIDSKDVRRDAAKMDETAPNQLVSLPTSHPDGPSDPNHQLLLANLESQRLSNSAKGMEMSEQQHSAEAYFGNARTALSDCDSSVTPEDEEYSPSAMRESASIPASQHHIVEEDGMLDLCLRSQAGSCDIFTVATAKRDCASKSLPGMDLSESAERSHCALPSSVKATQETGSRGSGETSRNVRRGAHIRIDSLSPFTPMVLAEQPEVDTPGNTTENAALSSRRSIPNLPTAQGAPSALQSIQSRITFLEASQHQEASFSNQNAAVYAQCCVCLEKHGEYNMLEITSCKHRYRELCLKKAIKVGSLRRFNCSSCRIWTATQIEDTIDMTNSGRL